jgi:hypothetical protein
MKDLTFDPGQVLSAAGIHPDLFPLLDKGGDQELVTCLEGDRLGIARD